MIQRFRSIVVNAALAGAAALVCQNVGAQAQPGVKLQAPHYGDTLFHFYQDKHFESITGLMVSQHFNRVAQHADEAEVLRGGLMLSYGLHTEAGKIFVQLIERGTAPAVRDRAWFFLAKIRHQRGLINEAQVALDRVGDQLVATLEEDRGLLQSNLMLARGEYAAAATLLTAMTTPAGAGVPAPSASSTPSAPYARFNLGVALVKSGDVLRGSALLDELGRAPAADDEAWSLRDKANVALGFAALQDGQPQAARPALERVRLNGLHSNKALLGFGWAAAALKQPQLALVPWAELGNRELDDAAVLEARIAVPYAYAELGAYGQSLERYLDAISTFDREGRRLDDSIAAVRAGKLVDGLLERHRAENIGWLWNLGELPQMPHAGHLAPVLAGHPFQEAFKNLRDLQFLGRNLSHWNDKVGVYGDMLLTRQEAYASRLPKTLARSREITLGALQTQRELLSAQLRQAQIDADGRAFADARQHDLTERIQRLQQALATGVGLPDATVVKERVRLAAGALTWQLAQDHSARVWDAAKGLSAIDTGLAQAQRREAALVQAQRDEPAKFSAFAQRLAALGERLRGLQPQVVALAQEQRVEVEQIAVAALESQKTRLAEYTMQARFAVAQLYDRAQVAAVKPANSASDASPTQERGNVVPQKP